VAGGSGKWREVVLLHGFGLFRCLSSRASLVAFGHGLGTSSGPTDAETSEAAVTVKD
jgi:hypothetical protein